MTDQLPDLGPQPLPGRLSEADLFQGYRATPSDRALDVTTPARVYVNAPCPNCGELARLVLDVDAALLWDDDGSTLRLKTRSKPVDHVCGQQSLIERLQAEQEQTDSGDVPLIEAWARDSGAQLVDLEPDDAP